MANFLDLPEDVLRIVVAHLSPKEKVFLAATCTTLLQPILFEILHVDKLSIEAPPVPERVTGERMGGYGSRYDQWAYEIYSVTIGFKWCDSCWAGFFEVTEGIMRGDDFLCQACKDDRDERWFLKNRRWNHPLWYVQESASLMK